MSTDERTTVASEAPNRSGRERWFVILYRPGPNWIAGKPLVEQRISAHLAYMAELCGRGSVASAGGFLDADSGGMLLLRAPDLAAAQTVIENDPAVRDGVFVGTARPFHPMFGAATRAVPAPADRQRIDDNLQVVRQLFAIVSSRADGIEAADRLAAYAALYDEAAVIHEAPSLPYGGDYEGRSGVARHAQAFRSAWDGLQSAHEQRIDPRLLADGDSVVVLWRQKAHAEEGSGERFEMPMVSVHELKDKRIVESRMFHFDAAATRDFLARADPSAAAAAA